MSREEGAPIRLYSALKLGYKMVKWLDEIVYQPVRTGGYGEISAANGSPECDG